MRLGLERVGDVVGTRGDGPGVVDDGDSWGREVSKRRLSGERST